MGAFDPIISQAAQRYRVDPSILRRLLVQESGLNPSARSPAGAQGIAQFMPGTAKQYGVNVNDPRSSIFAAAHYLRDNLNRVGGSYTKALSIYNSGRPDGYRHISETANYVRSILGGRTPNGGTGGGGGSALTQLTGSVTPGKSNAAFNAGSGSQDLSGLIATLAQQQKPVMPQQSLPDPATSSMRYLRSIQGPVPSGGGPQPQQPDALASILSAIQTPQQAIPQTSVSAPKVSVSGQTTQVPGSVPKGAGVAKFDGKPVAHWIAPILAYARAHGWKGTVTSGYRTVQEQARIYNSGVRPAAQPGKSNHNFTAFPGGAVDATDSATLARIIARSPYRGVLVWAGAKDAPHFSHPHNGGY